MGPWPPWYKLLFGFTVMAFMMPLVGPCVGCAVAWHYLLASPFYKLATWINTVTQGFNERFTKHPADAFCVNMILAYGVLLPLFFLYHLHYTMTNGFSVLMCFWYNVFRIGPYFMNFAYVYTMCHKEGHSAIGIFKNKRLSNVFNWWIGLFFGVLPSTFAYGHSKNHHQYSNKEQDVVSTADQPRDSFLNFVAYMPRFFLYAINISSSLQFVYKGDYRTTYKMISGTAYYVAFVALIMYLHPVFAAFYVIYAFFENVVILAAINWCWHAFLDPMDPENDYASSLTILDGQINVMNEDYHVVHHAYPGHHWTKNPDLYKKHEREYADKQATIFRDTHPFEVFFMIILKQYTKLAKKFVDLNDQLTLKEKEQLIRARLRFCWWGPQAQPHPVQPRDHARRSG